MDIYFILLPAPLEHIVDVIRIMIKSSENTVIRKLGSTRVHFGGGYFCQNRIKL